jgi:hypothetical protein
MEEPDRDAGEIFLRGGCSGSLFSLAKFELVLPNALRPRAGHRSRELVDLSVGAGADSFARFAEPPLFPAPSRRNSPAKSKRLIVNNNEICTPGELRVQKQRRCAARDRK